MLLLDPQQHERFLQHIEAFVEDNHPLRSEERTLLLLGNNLGWHLRHKCHGHPLRMRLGTDAMGRTALFFFDHRRSTTSEQEEEFVLFVPRPSDYPTPSQKHGVLGRSRSGEQTWNVRAGHDWIDMRDALLMHFVGWTMYVHTRALARNRELRGPGVAYYDSFEWHPDMAQRVQLEEDHTRAGRYTEPALLSSQQQVVHRIVDYVHQRYHNELLFSSALLKRDDATLLERMAQFLMWQSPLFGATWSNNNDHRLTLTLTHPYWAGASYHLSSSHPANDNDEDDDEYGVFGWTTNDKDEPPECLRTPDAWRVRCLFLLEQPSK